MEALINATYSKTCLKWPLQKMTKIGFQDLLLLNAGQKYCRMLEYGWNYPWLELFFIVPSLFEPLKFYCISIESGSSFHHFRYVGRRKRSTDIEVRTQSWKED